MKKLYRKGTVHPSPPPIISDHHLSFLPAAILSLTTALSPEDREVLAYLLSCSSTHPITTPSRRSTPSSSSSSRANNGGDHLDHPPKFICDCFTCYMSYWVRWDTSPNRQLIHEIIDAYEDVLARESKFGNGKNKKERRNNRNRNNSNNNKRGGRVGAEPTQSELASSRKDELAREVGSSSGGSKGGEAEASGGGGEVEERGSVRRFVNFIGEKIWGAWN